MSSPALDRMSRVRVAARLYLGMGALEVRGEELGVELEVRLDRELKM